MSADAPEPPDGAPWPPSYTLYRTRPRFLSGRPPVLRPGSKPGKPRGRPALGGARAGGPITPRRALKWLALGLCGWVALAGVLFLISAQFLQDKVDDATRRALSSGGAPVVSPSTILILGSDLRAPGSKEPGAQTAGPSRSDSIQLLRIGGGKSAKLSIPRDTAVPIPGFGTNKINAAFALGGSALAVRTIKDFLGIGIDHVVLVNFDRFPKLVDAMGGVTYTGGCVVSRINGGFKRGGSNVKAELSLALLGVGAVTLVAIVREDRADLAVIVDDS